jgi:hypothetical protein
MTVASYTDHFQNHTIYIEGFDPNQREDIIDLASFLVCYSKSYYLKESSKFYDFSGKRLDSLNLPIGRIYIVTKWVDDFNYIKPKKRIASIDGSLNDKIKLKIFDHSFPDATVVYSLSDLGIDYDNLECN